MSLLVVLNELSYRDTKAHREKISESLHGLVALLRQIRRARQDVALITEAHFVDLVFDGGYSVREWAGDGRNRDAFRYIRGLQNRAPFRDVAPDDLRNEAEYFHVDRSAEGLGTAHLLGGLAVSIRLGKQWETALLQLTRQTMGEDDSGDLVLVNGTVDVRHASEPGHLDDHRKWMVDSELTGLSSGAELWSVRVDLFPHLRFLPRVEDDLTGLPMAWLDPVKGRLAELELTASQWERVGTAAPQWRSMVTPDSDSRKHLCRFVDEDGELRLFDWHARFTPHAGRLHFRMDASAHRLVVAYIGAKLSTTRP